MNELQVFNNSEFGELRTVTIDGEPWFVGKDVATALGYNNSRDAIAKHVDAEDLNTVAIRDGVKGNPNMTVINESGLYTLILSSKLPTAKRFKRWVTAEVLPSLRKTGSYSLAPIEPAVPRRVLNADDYLRASAIVSTCRNERLPYVLHYLTAGGFEPPRIADKGPADESAHAVRLIREAQERGLSPAQIGKITGLDLTYVDRYTRGQSFPVGGCAAYIVYAMERALAEM
jgi:prophage antirepressor-like protein